MNLGAIAGLSGLSKSVDRAAETQKEFATMDNLQNDIQKEKQSNMLAQEMEAKQYEDVANKASELLEPDRQKIRAKSLELQQSIRSKIEEYGSRKAFFENGGFSLLSKYKSDLLTSEETLSYQDNKKNMESLIKIQESGKGDLISKRDMESLTNYRNGIGDGKIIYSGLKSEVKIPEKYFNYQEEIPSENILMYGSNYMAIYNNWLLENPNKKGLMGKDLKNELLLYTAQNHSGQGVNEIKYQNDIAKQNKREEEDKINKAGTGAETAPKSFVSLLNESFNAGKEAVPLNISNLMSEENYSAKMASKNPQMSVLLGDVTPYNDIASNYTSASSNISFGGQDQWMDKLVKKGSRALGFDNKYKVAGAITIPANTKGVIDFLYPGSTNAGSVIVTLNQSAFYSPNGQKLKKNFVEEHSDAEPMKYEGLIYGFIDGNDKMAVKKLDSNGKPLDKEDEKAHRSEYSGDFKQEMFSVLVNSDGQKIFQKLGANSVSGESRLSTAIGVSDDVSNQIKSREEHVQKVNQKAYTSNLNKKVLQNEVAIASSEGGIFSTNELKNDFQLSKVGDGSNRATLTKSYYMALSAMKPRINGSTGMTSSDLMLSDGFYKRGSQYNFEKAVNYSKELADNLKNKSNINDVNYIKLFTKISSAGIPEHEAHNAAFEQTWIKIYELLNKK